MNDTAKPLPTTEINIEIPFFDVDLMGVAWHGHYVKYFEVARGALMDKFSYGYAEMKKSGYSWPVVELKLRYVHPARLGQKITIRAMLREFELRLAVDYLITDTETGARLSKGHTIQVPVDMKTQEMVFGTPPVLYRKLGIQK
jgi:acyl-CoA thioester hydrolase